jgi:hypothetical protein
VRVHEGRATDVAAKWEEPIDLLLLDGDQSPEGVRAAYEAWEPHLKPGGILVLRNAAVRDYAEGHDGHRLLASHEVVPGRYDDICQLADTVIARKPRPEAARFQTLVPRTHRGLRVHLYAQCWNDEFMLPYFFRHYDPFVDRYIIFDDGSTDYSLDILKKHPKVELRRFVRSEPDSFVLSEQALSNACWKESRGSADWVIVTDVDEHLHHPAMREYLQRCTETGVTAIPALGFQMIGDEPTQIDEQLCRSHVLGAPWSEMMKLSIFDPDQIREINFLEGRHRAEPVGNVVVPSRDEVLLLHYKYLGIERTFRRQQQLRLGLGSKDIARNWGIEYFSSQAELGKDWKSAATSAVNVHQMTADAYPIEPWWSRWPRASEAHHRAERQAALVPFRSVSDPAWPDPLSRVAFEAAVAAHRSAIASELAVIDTALGVENLQSEPNYSSAS